MEALNYALSYNNKDSDCLCLLGRVYMKFFKDYEKAKSCFQEALSENMNNKNIYPHYIKCLLKNEDFKEAKKLIDFALTVKGINKREIYFKKILYFEKIKNYNKALKAIKKVKEYIYKSEDINYLKDEEKRLKEKLKKKSINKDFKFGEK